MKKILAVLALVFACLWGTAFAADFSHLVILHTNDTHGYDQRADGVNGMATVAALKKDYEAKGYKVLSSMPAMRSRTTISSISARARRPLTS